jgi:cytochrome c biogenesis protein CcdA
VNTLFLTFFAGAAGILSPCILPLLPIITTSALSLSRWGLLFLSLGLSLSFALTGSVLTFALLQLNISTEIFRFISAYILLFFALALLIKPLGDKLSGLISRLGQYLPLNFQQQQSQGFASQFFIGLGLGAIWLPCVGPTLGAAIALAANGEDLLNSFVIMASYGLGAGIALSVIGLMSAQLFGRVKGQSAKLRFILGLSLLIVSVLVISGGDKYLETLALRFLPDWLYGF